MLIVTRKQGERIVIVNGDRKIGVTMLHCRSDNGNRKAFARLHLDGDVEPTTVNVRVGCAWQCCEDVVIDVMGVGRGQAQIGVEAPREITVDREEVYLKKLEAAGHG